MICRVCGSEELGEFTGELAIHFPGLRDLNKPVVWVFPEIWVCLNCGNAGLSVPENALRVLAAETTIPVTSSPAPSNPNQSITESQENEAAREGTSALTR
jgi:hypothetical protein